MAKTMKAAVIHSFTEPLRIEQVPIPEVGIGQILVKIAAAGVCHSDLHIARGELFVNSPLPIIPGHEGAGHVAEVGPGVTNLQKGDAVGVTFYKSCCNLCEFCAGGKEIYCPDIKACGYTQNGFYAEYVVVDAKYAHKWPANLDMAEHVSILCAGVTTYKAIKETEVRTGQWLAILGIGGLGHLAVQYAKVLGLKVVAVDIRSESLTLAKELGADIVIDASKEDPVKRVLNELGGVHASVITSVAPASFDQGVQMLRRHGTSVFIGLPKENVVPINLFDMILCRKTIRGSLLGTRVDVEEALAFAAEGKIRIHHSVDKLENINGILERMANGRIQGRVVLKF